MPVSERARRIWLNATGGLRKKLAEELAAQQRKINPSVASAMYPNHPTEAEVRAMLVGAPGVTQQVRAGRDAYTAGRDQTVRVDNRRPGE